MNVLRHHEMDVHNALSAVHILVTVLVSAWLAVDFGFGWAVLGGSVVGFGLAFIFAVVVYFWPLWQAQQRRRESGDPVLCAPLASTKPSAAIAASSASETKEPQ